MRDLNEPFTRHQMIFNKLQGDLFPFMKGVIITSFYPKVLKASYLFIYSDIFLRTSTLKLEDIVSFLIFGLVGQVYRFCITQRLFQLVLESSLEDQLFLK